MANIPNAPQMLDGKQIMINQVQPLMKNFSLVGIVIRKGVVRRMTAGNEIHTLRIADGTGSINVSIMTGEYEPLIQPGDVLRMKNLYTNIFKGQMTVTCGRQSELARVGEFHFPFTETPNFSEYSQELFNAHPNMKKTSQIPPPHDGSQGGGPPLQHDPRHGNKDPRQAPTMPPNLGMRPGQKFANKDPRLARSQ